MTTFTLTINCDNTAFEDNQGSEIARILCRLAEHVDGRSADVGRGSGAVFDANGNRVGEWRIEG